MQPTLRIAEASRRLRVHPDTLRRLEKRGHFLPHRTLGGHRRFSEADLWALAVLLNRTKRLMEEMEEAA